MAYSLDPTQPVTARVREVAMKEFQAAQSWLSDPDFHLGIHNARRSLKRLRSLLWLIRPGLPEPLFGHLEQALKTIAKDLAPARDAQALVDTIDKLAKKTSKLRQNPAIDGLRIWLNQRRDEAEAGQIDPAAKVVAELESLRIMLGRLSIYPDDFSPLAKGSKSTYRASRQAFHQAFAEETDEALHEWRKEVQHHWRHMQLLTPCWPEALNARAERLHRLAQLLGDDHDLANLRKLLSTPTVTFGDTETALKLAKRCRKYQKTLRAMAKTLGTRLFNERPKDFAQRIETHWVRAAGRVGVAANSSTANGHESADGNAAGNNVLPFGAGRAADLKLG